MELYKKSGKAWRDHIQPIAAAIDGDYWVSTGHHLDAGEASDLALALILDALKNNKLLEVDPNTNEVTERPLFWQLT